MSVIAKTDGDPQCAAGRRPVEQVARGGSTTSRFPHQTIESAQLAQSLGVQRIVAVLTTVFAGVALVLAAIGLLLGARLRGHAAHE